MEPQRKKMEKYGTTLTSVKTGRSRVIQAAAARILDALLQLSKKNLF